jgi:hypothetical protein
MENLSHDSRSPGRYFNPGSSKHEAGVLTIRPRHSVRKQSLKVWNGFRWLRKCPLILPVKYYCHTPQGFLTCLKILRHGADGFTSLRRKSCEGFLWALKIYRPRPG